MDNHAAWRPPESIDSETCLIAESVLARVSHPTDEALPDMPLCYPEQGREGADGDAEPGGTQRVGEEGGDGAGKAQSKEKMRVG